METKCPNCGELNSNTRFCIYCGRKLTEEGEEYYKQNIVQPPGEYEKSDFIYNDGNKPEETYKNTIQREEPYPNRQNTTNEIPLQVNVDEKFCIVCGNTIKISASTCRHCGAQVTPSSLKPNYGQNFYPAVSSKDGDGLGIQSVILGVLGLLCCPILSPAAIVQGYRAKLYPNEEKLGTIGMWIGAIDIVIWIIRFIISSH